MPERHLYRDEDPRGLIHEAYRMDIVEADARSIFFDWAMGEAGVTLSAKLDALIAHYVPQSPDHPMSAVLLESRKMTAQPKRRGGRSGRIAD